MDCYSMGRPVLPGGSPRPRRFFYTISRRRRSDDAISPKSGRSESKRPPELRYDHFIDLLDTRPLSDTSRHSIENILQILAHEKPDDDDENQRLRELLRTCSAEEDVSEVTDSKGFNVVQRAVVGNYLAFLRLFFRAGFPSNMNDTDCNAPLHLACKLGNHDVLKLLLDYGADVTYKSTACYPRSVFHGTLTSSRTGVLRYCYSQKFSPMEVTLTADDPESMNMLLNHPRNKDIIDTTYLLNSACKANAAKCARYLVCTLPHQVNRRMPDSDETPLCVAMNKSDACCLAILPNFSGAKYEDHALKDCSGKGDSVLHILFGSTVCVEVYHLLQGFMDPCSFINVPDNAGNTPLHALAKNIGLRMQDKDLQVIRDREVMKCVQFLLDNGADVNRLNKKGESCLHLIFENNKSRKMFGMGSGYCNAVFTEVNKVLQILLERGASVNSRSSRVASVINWVVSVLCSIEAFQVKAAGDKILNAIEILCDFGANPNYPDEQEIYIVTRVFTATNRWLNHSVDDLNLAHAITDIVHKLLTILFKHGLCPPVEIRALCVKQIAIIANINLPDAKFGDEVKKFLVPLLCSGLHPNRMRALPPPAMPGTFMPLGLGGEVQYFLARALVIHRHHGGMLSLFNSFEQLLTQSNLNLLVGSLCRGLKQDFDTATYRELTHHVKALSAIKCRPRPLKVLCRIAVNDALSWRLIQKRQNLPLPAMLQDYLTALT